MSVFRHISRVPMYIGHELFITTRSQKHCYWSSIFIYRTQSSLPNPKPEKTTKITTQCETPKDIGLDKLKKTALNIKSLPKEAKISVKEKLNAQQVRRNVEGYVNTRYFDYLSGYTNLLEKKFPAAVKVYRVFVDGVKEFYNDMKRYLKISKIAYESPKGLKALNRKELELYMKMPKDMLKVAPALIICSLPMIGYPAMALVFMYPNTFLTTHFWTLQQRVQFQENILKSRFKNNREVFRCLQAKISSIKDKEDKERMQYILGLLGSGFHPTVSEILEVKHIFAKFPYHILDLPSKHIKLLTKMHGAPTFFFKRFRLREHAFLIHYMDLAILSEGDVHNMPHDALRNACFLRGLNPANLSNDEMIEWLRNWVKISTSIGAEHLSLFLHLPLFLAYNHTNNWKLIYTDKQQQ